MSFSTINLVARCIGYIVIAGVAVALTINYIRHVVLACTDVICLALRVFRLLAKEAIHAFGALRATVDESIGEVMREVAATRDVVKSRSELPWPNQMSIWGHAEDNVENEHPTTHVSTAR